MSPVLAPPTARSKRPIPPLEPGDHLTRDEFERRFDATPGLKKAELIEGIVFMPPPAVRWDYHAEPHFDLIGWLSYYKMATPGVRAGDNSSVRLNVDNEPQPDAILFIDPALGGSARISNGYIEGAPEFVAEVSATTASIDLNAKLRMYRRNGVREYMVWRVLDQAVDWFILRKDRYSGLALHSDGLLHSKILPGLWLAPDALVSRNQLAVIDALRQGLASDEHARFVEKLRARRNRRTD